MAELAPFSIEAINELSQHVELAHTSEIQSARERKDTKALHAIAQRLFSTCRTSLLNVPLDGIPSHPELQRYIKNLHIQDDSDKVDPIAGDGTVESPYIWPRNKAILDITPITAGVEHLRKLLLVKQICPDVIKVEDYAICPGNVEYCTEKTRTQLADFHINAYAKDHNGPVATLAKNIIDGANLAVLSVNMQSGTAEIQETNYLTTHNNTDASIGGPQILRVTIELSAGEQGENCGFSLMHSADLQELQTDPYWLEQVLCHAPQLENLKLSSINGSLLTTLIRPNSFTPKLKHLELHNINMDASTIQALLVYSSPSLTSLHLRSIALHPGSTWNDLLPKLAEHLPSLAKFDLIALAERTGTQAEIQTGPGKINFYPFTKEMISEECREGLTLHQRGRIDTKGGIRLTRIGYEGAKAGLVLKKLADYAHWHRDE